MINPYSRQGYVKASRRAARELVENHGLKQSDFVTLRQCRREGNEPSLGVGWIYPKTWARGPHWLNARCLPAGAVIYWPDGVDCTGEGHDPVCAVYLLNEIEAWDAYYEEEGLPR